MTIIQPPVCAPKVKEFMLKPGYWTKKIRNAEKLILNEEEIIEFNKKSFRKMKSKGYEEWLYDLETYPETITGEELLNTMKTYSSEEVFPDKTCYDIHANKIPKIYKKEVLHQSNFGGIPDEIRIRWGMLVKREDIRAFPTDTVFAEDPKGIDLSLIHISEPTRLGM